MSIEYAKEQMEKGLSRYIPPHMHGAMRRWVMQGIMPGGFLSAVLSNDLMGAAGRADDENRDRLIDYCTFLYSHAPSGCFGSPTVVASWNEDGGLEGIFEMEPTKDV